MAFSSRPPKGSAMMASMFGVPYPPPGLVNMETFRANSCNQPLRFREAIRLGKPLVGTCLSIPSLPVARLMATMGYDWIFIDGEHSPMGPDLMTDLIKTINYHSEGTMAAVVRLPTHGHEWIAWALDAGAAGIILPHTETVEQVKHIVSSARFPPHGERSYPPFAQFPGFTDGTPDGKFMLDVWNDNAAIIVQIESRLGSENAEAIAAVEGVDGIMIGMGDLRLNMRLPLGFSGQEPEYVEAIDRIENAAKRKGLPLFGFALGEEMIQDKLANGYKGLMVAADTLALVHGQAATLTLSREAVKAYDDKEVKVKKVNGVKKVETNGLHAANGILVNDAETVVGNEQEYSTDEAQPAGRRTFFSIVKAFFTSCWRG